MMPEKIRVLLVNEIPLLANVIADVLNDELDITVVETVENVQQALAHIQDDGIDIVLVSTRLPGDGALQLTRSVTEKDPNIKVLALGVAENTERILQFVEAGASGYIRSDHSVGDLLESIRAAQSDRAKVSPKVAAALIERVSELTDLLGRYQAGVSTDFDELTPRELEVLGLVAQGYSNRRIADTLFIEVGTVKNHVHSILTKLDVGSRDDAAAYLAIVRQGEGGED